MGPALQNLDQLLKMPFGCGEQNMVQFAPNIFILQYLKKTKQLDPEIEVSALYCLRTGEHFPSYYSRGGAKKGAVNVNLVWSTCLMCECKTRVEAMSDLCQRKISLSISKRFQER